MPLKDTLFGLIDNVGLAEKFNLKPVDKTAARKPLLRGIEKAREQFSAEPRVTKAPNRWWSVKNGVVALTVKVNGDTFDINGVATNHMPEERFLDFLDKFKAAVDAGEFDDELNNKGNGDAKVHISKAGGEKKPRNMSEQSRLNIRVGGWRRGGQEDDEIKARLKAEGVSKEMIDAALAPKGK